MIIFVFTKKSEKEFSKLPSRLQGRIIEKLKELKNHPNIFSILKKTTNMEPCTHRLRIGNYRLLLKLTSQKKSKIEFWVLKIGDRKNIYK